MAMNRVMARRIRIGYIPQPPSLKDSSRNMRSFSLSWVSSWKFGWPCCSAPRLRAQRRLGLEEQVGHVLLHLGDVVEGGLGAAVQPRERGQADDAGGEA